MNLNELISTCHGASLAAGWWHDLGTGEMLDALPLVPEKLALCHSEVSEAYLADCIGARDDKLVERLGYEVELADVVIRCADLLGALYPSRDYPDWTGYYVEAGTLSTLMEINVALSRSLEALRKGGDAAHGLIDAISYCIAAKEDSFEEPIDVMAAVEAKLAFNRQRAIDGDHSLEASRAAGGKKF